ncbi:rhodanese-like domain-containing protein 4A, chloroplastic [Aristolochia californica]|uniref:rhodanese-like domain-containing protein 4A, chloroplastic n=1 Tax=Aristolochia californica TaxID=171875 RepID=UPI0035E3621F
MEVLSVSCVSLQSIQTCSRTHKPELKISFLLNSSPRNHISVVKPVSEFSNSQRNCLSYLQALFPLNRWKSLPLNSPQFSLFISKSSPILKIATAHLIKCHENHFHTQKAASSPKVPSPHLSDTLLRHVSSSVTAYSIRKSSKFYILPLVMSVVMPVPSAAAETSVSAEQMSGRINIESVLLSIDDFFNRYPFFVATVTFIWLVVIPLTEQYFKKYKFISAFDGYRKLNDDPNAHLLDIRNKQSLEYLGSPNLTSMMKKTLQVEFTEGEEESFVKEVLKNFSDPGKTVVCVIDNFDGNSLKVAELLFKSGFKAAYAIKGGLRGKDGWQEIQENLLPPHVHVYSKRKKKKTSQLNVRKDEGKVDAVNSNGVVSTSDQPEERKQPENGYLKASHTSSEPRSPSGRPSSPYPNYADLKPPSSPTPSKPRN